MKIKELLILESSAYLDGLKRRARNHYPDVETDDEAVIHLLGRSVNHAEEDDERQDAEIDQLEDKEAREISQLADRLTNVEDFIKQFIDLTHR
jgi:hypothetical protein